MFPLDGRDLIGRRRSQCPRLGRHLAALPCHPRLGKILVLGWESGCGVAAGGDWIASELNRVYAVGL